MSRIALVFAATLGILVGAVGCRSQAPEPVATESTPTATAPPTSTEPKLPEGTAAGLRPNACGTSASPGGRVYRVQIPSTVDQEPIVFQVFEPDAIDCTAKHALLVQGHGYAGSRQTEKTPGITLGPAIGPFTAAGYAVISIDQRGSGESGGTIRVMDPAYEGRDLATILDWAEQHLDYLKYRDGNLLLGSFGGSYGGGSQMLLWATDPKARLDAIVPAITWNDLAYSISGGDVAKSFWIGFLGSGGDINTRGRQDPYVRAVLANTLATGRMPEAAKKQLFTHSPAYHCGQDVYGYGDLKGTVSKASDFALASVSGSGTPLDGFSEVTVSPLKKFNKVDALIIQGNRDNLFNLNEGYANYQCLKKGGGDVRMITSEDGHGAVTGDVGLVYGAVAVQGAPNTKGCGPITEDAATLAWFNEKLLNKGKADDVILSKNKICLSLQANDVVAIDSMEIPGEEFKVELPGGLPATVVSNQAVPTIVPLKTITQDSEVVGGIPRVSLTLSGVIPQASPNCPSAADPFIGTASCDSTVFIGLGLVTASTSGKPPGVPELIDNQVMPFRGFGQFESKLVGVGERLRKGDQLVLLLYGTAPIYAGTASRDLLASVTSVTGKVWVPLQGNLPSLK